MEAKKSLKVLNIGNSFSNSLKVFFPDVVASAGCELQLEAASHGGCELHRHWKYITASEPWATACSEASRCMPGLLSRQTSCQFTWEGVDSISTQGFVRSL